MWIYPEAPAQTQVDLVHAGEASGFAEHPQKPKKQPEKEAPSAGISGIPKKNIWQNRTGTALFAGYIAGLLIAGLIVSRVDGRLSDYVRYYAECVVKIHRSGDGILIFSVRYLSAFLQFSLALLSGLCAFGKPIIYMLALLKGAGAGLFTAALYSAYQFKGLLLYAALFCIADAVLLYVFLGFSQSCAVHAGKLASICFSEKAGEMPTLTAQKLVSKYLISCVAVMLPIAITALLAVLFLRP